MERHRQRRRPVHQELHDRDKQHQHDEIVHRYLHQRVGRVPVGEMAPDKHHRRTRRGGQNDAARDVLVGFGRSDEGRKDDRKNTHASSAIENGLTTQLTNSVTSSPAGRRPTFFTDEKSTFIIIGVIISQIRTAIGALIWLPCAELDTAQARDSRRQQLSKPDARHHAERHPDRQVALERTQARRPVGQASRPVSRLVEVPLRAATRSAALGGLRWRG